MIFHRIKAHIEKENWFALFLDFFIVVVGVFIGIQVANWNEERNAVISEKVIMQRLADEMTVISTELQSWLAHQSDGLRNTEAMHKEMLLINAILKKELKP